MLIVNQLENVSGKVIIVRADFNVPLKSGVIKDDNRISAALPTIKELISKGAKVVLMSHLGKIKHKEAPEIVAEAKAKNDLAPVAIRLSELLGQKVNFVNATRGAVLTDAVKALLPGEVLLMQNTRYEKGEEKNDAELSAIWANLADGFVMDAFGSAHRA
ncbi:MAG: phosphoglycerate kinase, partial [Bacilli bacterium]